MFRLPPTPQSAEVWGLRSAQLDFVSKHVVFLSILVIFQCFSRIHEEMRHWNSHGAWIMKGKHSQNLLKKKKLLPEIRNRKFSGVSLDQNVSGGRSPRSLYRDLQKIFFSRISSSQWSLRICCFQRPYMKRKGPFSKIDLRQEIREAWFLTFSRYHKHKKKNVIMLKALWASLLCLPQ